MQRREGIAAALACALALAACTKPPAVEKDEAIAGEGVTAEITLRPVRDDGEEVQAVKVEAIYRGALPNTKAFSMTSPIIYAGRAGMADAVDDLVVTDAAGPVALRIDNDPVNPGGFPYFRHWRAEREVTPPVAVSYRMRPNPTPLRGPQFDLYAHGGGMSSGGMALFVWPEDVGEATWRVEWDLDDLAPDSMAASTHGEGDLELEGGSDVIVQAYYMAGPMGRYASQSQEPSFFAYWLGETPFDAPEEMAWAADAYDYLSDFFGDNETPSYKVFVRAVDAEEGLGGTALGNSFMVGVAAGRPDASATAPRGTIFHEMGHMFVGGLSNEPPGGAAWFGEGLNVHYTRLLLLRSGFAPVSEYLESINQSARNYYSSPYRTASADELFELGFSTGVGAGSAQNVAYTRGSLYFADVDAKIRAASSGERTLDDAILPLFERRRNGEPLTRELLIDALARQIGPGARQDLESVILQGELITPPPDAFGPCFERRPKTYGEGGERMEGYEWVRLPDMPDSECRTW